MRKLLLTIIAALTASFVYAEDGHRLWLRYDIVRKAQVEGPIGSPTSSIAITELENHFLGSHAMLRLDPTLPDDEGFTISGNDDQLTITARRPIGLLYGAYEVLRLQATDAPIKPMTQKPQFKLRLLNHWDNLDGSIERGYAGNSIFEWFHLDENLIREYARANASIGINGSVLNNVNASPKMLTKEYLREVKKIADILRPYGIRVYLSINFATPMAMGYTTTADPKDAKVARWWKSKAREIYKLIPDFGGFLVKANSEGQPGPGDYQRSHADGANMLAEALEPFGGIVMWRCFVYGANHKGEDRVKQAVSEFKPLDGQFHKNVILQTKNGPLDFQPREPYSPIFDQIRETPNMAELQITMEYLGQSTHLVYLAPMWKEFFHYVEPQWLTGIAGVANIGKDTNWCGHHFAQANWYCFGRLAWNPQLSSEAIAREWLEQTFTTDETFVNTMTAFMEDSREACVNYMMPLGLHHIFNFDHHYGPDPGGFKPEYPIEWCPVYYHKADKNGVGFDRTSQGSNAVSQYREPYASQYNKLETCPENLLLWFHHVPWDYKMKDGSTLWESLQYHYTKGVIAVESMHNTWHTLMRHYVDEQRWREVDERLSLQETNAREWRDICLKYFGQFVKP